MKFDDLIIQLGEFGRYQRRVYFLICTVAVASGWHSIAPVFLAGESDHWCVVPELETEDCSRWQLTPNLCQEAKKDASIPPQTQDHKTYEYDNCLRYNLTNVPFYPGVNTPDYTNDTFGCDDGWVYDTSQLTSTVISDFNLVCSKSSLVGLSQSIYFGGLLVGSLVFGPLSDMIGRYYTYFITAGLFFESGVATAFSPNYISYTIFRFLVGAALIGVFVAQFVLVTEFVGPTKRMHAGMGTQFGFSIGYITLIPLAYFIRDWWILQLVISAPLILLFLMVPVITESPRWLMSKGRFDEAEKIIQDVARVNKAKLSEPLLTEGEKQKILDENNEKKPSALDLFKTPTLRWRTLNLMFNWAVNSMVYYGLALNTSSLGSDPYLAALFSALVEIPALVWVVFGIEWIGRKPNLCGLLVIGGVMCLSTIGIAPGTALTVVTMLGKFCISATFSLIYIYTAEMYPTPLRVRISCCNLELRTLKVRMRHQREAVQQQLVRHTTDETFRWNGETFRGAGMGLCSTASRISSMLSPIILIIGDYWPPLPLIIFGSSAVIAGFLVLLLPETKGLKLAETIEEGENFGKNVEMNTLSSESKTNPGFAPDL